MNGNKVGRSGISGPSRLRTAFILTDRATDPPRQSSSRGGTEAWLSGYQFHLLVLSKSSIAQLVCKMAANALSSCSRLRILGMIVQSHCSTSRPIEFARLMHLSTHHVSKCPRPRLLTCRYYCETYRFSKAYPFLHAFDKCVFAFNYALMAPQH